MYKRCPNCHKDTDISEGRAKLLAREDYCTDCGTKLQEFVYVALTCENCHKVLASYEAYCENCGFITEVGKKREVERVIVEQEGAEFSAKIKRDLEELGKELHKDTFFTFVFDRVDTMVDFLDKLLTPPYLLIKKMLRRLKK